MKRLLAFLLALILIVGFAACRSGGTETPPGQTPGGAPEPPPDERPILRIGVPYTAGSTWAADQRNAMQLWLDSRNWEIGPYDIELIFVDDEGSVETALTRARLLVEVEDVHLIFGGYDTDIVYAIAEYAIPAGIPFITPSVTGDDLTQRRRHELVIRTGGSASQGSHLLGYWAFEQGFRRIATVSMDDTFGHESVAGFRRTFEDAGGDIIAQVWTQADAPDLVPFLDQIPAEIDALFIQYANQDALRILDAIYSMGFDVPILAGSTTIDASILSELSREAALNYPHGIFSVQTWLETSTDPQTRAFADAFYARFGHRASAAAMEAYAGLTIIEAAILETDGFIGNYSAFLRAVRSLEVQTPKGSVRIDFWNNPLQDYHISRITKGADGELYKQHVYTFPMVSQFWQYDPSEFLALPSYSRDFTTAEHNRRREEMRAGR